MWNWRDDYDYIRELPTGELAGIKKMIYTTAVVVGLDEIGYRTRFCFDGENQYSDACVALATWDGEGFPPGFWLKQKPQGITNPARQGGH